LQYIRHSFFVNFNNAIKYKDEQLMSDLLTDEIAKLSVFDQDSVAKALIGADVNISKRPKKKEIAQKVVKNLDNDELRKNIIKLIYKNNEALQKLPKTKKKLSAKAIDKLLEKQAKEEAENVNKHLFLNFCNGVSADGEENVINTEELNKKIEDKVRLHEGNQQTIASNLRPIDTKQLLYIIGGIWIFGIAVTQLTIWAFKKYEARKFAEGGEIEGENVQPVIDGLEQPPIQPDLTNNGITSAEQLNQFPEQPQQFNQPATQFPAPDLDLRPHYQNNNVNQNLNQNG